jgi:hypothetical protein
MADNIPEGLDDLLNSIRGEGKSQKSSAIVVVPKAEKKESDSVENEDIDPEILRLLGLEDVFDIDYDTYKTLLRERMAAGRMPDSKIPTEEVQLLTDEFKRVKGKTGRFKVKGQKIKKESFVGKKKTKTSAIVKAAPRAITKPQEDLKEAEAPVNVEVAEKVSDLDNAIRKLLQTSIRQDKEEEKQSRKERVAAQRAEQKEKEIAKEKKKIMTGVPGALKSALKPITNIFDTVGGFLKKFLFSTLIMELLRFLEDPIEYFRPLINWVNGVIEKVNAGIASVLKGIFDPINKVIEGANAQLVNLENAINPLLKKMGSSPLTIPKVPVIPTQSITDKMQIPLIKYPEPKSEPSILSETGPTKATATPTVGLTSMQTTALGYIKKYESASSGGYDAMNQGTVADRTGAAPKSGDSKTILGQRITDMTLGEVIRRQDKNLTNAEGFIHAAGAYQFTGDTLPGLAQRAGLKMTDKFSAANQDRLAVQLASERGAQPWLADPRNKLQFDQKALDAINSLKGTKPQFTSSITPASVSPTKTVASAPPPPKPAAPAPSIAALPMGGNTNGTNVSTATPNQKKVANFSAFDPTNPYLYAIKGQYNIVGA